MRVAALSRPATHDAGMNTVPASFTPPSSQTNPPGPLPAHAGLSVSGPRAPLRLVVDRPSAGPRPPQPYDLQGRRHLAGVPSPVESAQAPVFTAEDQGLEAKPPRRREPVAEPLAFALVLLISVAACVVALSA
jgi:hypothetical protein